jgi:hypothetical protein
LPPGPLSSLRIDFVEIGAPARLRYASWAPDFPRNIRGRTIRALP